jgi:hypothetical protein
MAEEVFVAEWLVALIIGVCFGISIYAMARKLS